MQLFLCFFLIVSAVLATGQADGAAPRQVLDHYGAFLQQSADEVAQRVRWLKSYRIGPDPEQIDAGFTAKRGQPGPLPAKSYPQARVGTSPNDALARQIQERANELWAVVSKIDRLTQDWISYDQRRGYHYDKFAYIDRLTAELNELAGHFNDEQAAGQQHLQQLYRTHQLPPPVTKKIKKITIHQQTVPASARAATEQPTSDAARILQQIIFSEAAKVESDDPVRSLNHYVDFLNQAVDEVARRFQLVQPYYRAMTQDLPTRVRPRLAPSGTLEEYYYKKALTVQGLTDAEQQRLKAGTQALWKSVSQLDQTVKALETYDRLGDFNRDGFARGQELVAEIKRQMDQFSRDNGSFYKQIQRIYRRYQPYLPDQPLLYTEKELEQVLIDQQQVLDTLSCYMNEKSGSVWPVALIQQSILTDEKRLTSVGQAQRHISYPAATMLSSFRAGLQTIQTLKRQAVDNYTFAARQSTQFDNDFYRQLIDHYNHDLLSWYGQFVNYSASTKQLLNYPKYAPVFAIDPPEATPPKTAQPESFHEMAPLPFAVKPAPAPVSPATFQALTGYVDFINESLSQLDKLQVLVRNYASSADYYRDPTRNGRRTPLTYAHEAFTVPLSEHQFLGMHTTAIPSAYRASINGQADELLAMLNEMDALSIELIDYTCEKRYEQDQLKRSDAILDRYAYLFSTFDQKKEQLYRDVRRIYESYPVKNTTDPWNLAGKALLRIVDTDKDILFGIRAYLKNEATHLPDTEAVQTQARTLIRDEFTNLRGLQRLGRNNGLCPYSRYEDLAGNSLRMSNMVRDLPATTTGNPYESFYFFYNNEIVYDYNEFSQLARVSLLKTIRQPNLVTFRRGASGSTPRIPQPPDRLATNQKPVSPTRPLEAPPVSQSTTPTGNGRTIQHDTVYIKQATLDTIYIIRSKTQDVPTSLNGFALNNMVLLLDVSGSMDAPQKLPLLKKSVKSLLKLLRAEDQLSIVVYSGKARVVLKPTSGTSTDEIIRVIDQLKSDGDTDGGEGLRLAYKVANKSYIRAGNNRIILATDGEFPIGDEVFQTVADNSRQDIYLTVFTFGRNELKSDTLKKLAQSGKGTYTHVTPENADLKLILEAQAKKMP